MSANPKLLSVIIVNYNGRRYLQRCLSSLEQQSLPRHRFEVIVVDNASSDDSVALVRGQFPWVRIDAQSENLGFVAGNQRGRQLAHGDCLVLLNNDTIVDPHGLAGLAWMAASQPEWQMIVAKLVFADRPNYLQSTGLELLRDGRARDRGFTQPDTGSYERAEEVFAGCGAALLVRCACIDRHGFFDPRLFMYYEDLELGWRLRRRKLRMGYAPQSLVLHEHAGSSGLGSAFFHRQVEANRLLTSLRHGDLALKLLAGLSGLARVFREGGRWLAAAGRGGSWARFCAFVAAFAACCWLVPRGLFLEKSGESSG